MKRVFILITATSLLLLYSDSAHNQALEKRKKTIGIGLLNLNLKNDIPLYLNSKSETAFDTIRFCIAQSGDEKNTYKMGTSSQLVLNPFSFYKGDSQKQERTHRSSGLVYIPPSLKFKVLEQVETNNLSGYTIVLNEETLETAFIRHDGMQNKEKSEGWYFFEAWETYLKRLPIIRRKGTTKLYNKIDGQVIKVIDKLSCKAEEVKGEWMKITSHMIKGKEMWIKWTDGVNLLVAPIEAVYY